MLICEVALLIYYLIFEALALLFICFYLITLQNVQKKKGFNAFNLSEN